jgi:hypothetical protein
MPSRADIFNNTPSEALPAPPDLRIAFFISSVKHKPYRVEDDGIVIDDAYYEPVRQDDDARECMSKAAAIYKLYKIKVPIIRTNLNGRERLFVRFADRDFEPIRKRKARSFRGKAHPEQQKADKQRISSRIPGLLERMEELILEKFGAELGQDAYFKTSVPLQDSAPSAARSRPEPENATNMLLTPSNTEGKGGAEIQALPEPVSIPQEVKQRTATPENTDASRQKAAPRQKPNQQELPKMSDSIRRLRERLSEQDEEAL